MAQVDPRPFQGSASNHEGRLSPAPPPVLASPSRSPGVSQIALPGSTSPFPSPNLPSSPGSSTNRFGLALNFIQRRPRGSTNPLAMGNRPPASPGAGRSPAASPSTEQPPSPSGGERTGGYGFPALRRQLSRRQNSGAGETTNLPARTRPAGRSSSQNADLNAYDAGANSDSGPQTPGADLDTPQPPFANLNASGATATGDLAPSPTTGSTETHRIRLVPHLESSRSLHFDPIDRDLASFVVLRVGRFTDRSNSGQTDPHKIAFKSKVVSRGHAEVWCDSAGKYFIKDTKSSSGTFLNHIRLSGPGTESRPFPLKDGDVLQLGVDYQGGTEEIYRCVKMRIELNRGWQRGMNSFNTAAMAQLRALGGGSNMEVGGTNASGAAMSAVPTQKAQVATASVTDCCICLYPVTVCQALFIAPCSHVTHYKCIRPLILQHYPGFSCPLCRTFADLEADVEIEPWEPEVEVPAPQPETVDEEPEEEQQAMNEDAPADTSQRAPSVRLASAPGGSRRSSLAVSGPDGVLVALKINEHRRPSATSLAPALVPSDSAQIEEDSPPPSSSFPAALPLPIAIDGGKPFITEIYDSLADAATPPNSTFLSTLADSGGFPRYQAPVSIDMAFNSLATADSEAGPSAHRLSFGSEEGTDELPTSSRGSVSEVASVENKGKGVEGRTTSPDTASKVVARDRNAMEVDSDVLA